VRGSGGHGTRLGRLLLLLGASLAGSLLGLLRGLLGGLELLLLLLSSQPHGLLGHDLRLGGLGLRGIALGLSQILFIRLELREEGGLLLLLLGKTLLALPVRLLLGLQEGHTRLPNLAAEHTHPRPGQRAQLEEGVLRADDQRGHGHRGHQDDSAHRGEEALEHSAEPRAHGASGRMRPTRIVREHELREHGHAQRQQHQRDDLRQAAALAVAHEDHHGPIEAGGGDEVGAHPEQSAQGLGDEVPDGPHHVPEPGAYPIVRIEGSHREQRDEGCSEHEDAHQGPAAHSPRLHLLVRQRLAARGNVLPRQDRLLRPGLPGRHDRSS
jgi:hypothetical protein